MRSITPSSPARRTRRLDAQRARRRPTILVAGLAVGLLTAGAMTVTTPAPEAEAASSFGGFALASYVTPIDTSTSAAAAAEAEVVATPTGEVLAEAEAALAAAASVTADIAASGLDVGVPDTTVDTTALEAEVDRIEQIAQVALPMPLETDLADVSSLIDTVSVEVSGLRGNLDAAVALKAEQEAAEKARLEAEAAAAAEAAAKAAAPSRPSAPAYAGGGAVGGTSPADAQATARGMLPGYGWGEDQFGCLVSLWNRESGWNYQAHNSSSGAHGIPQALPGSKMASAGADWQTNPATQIAWGLGYISGRYGSPCGAWDHSESVGWY